MTMIAITHRREELGRFFTDADLARVRAVGEVRILGGNERDLVLPQLHDVDVLVGSWGMPRLDDELLRAASFSPRVAVPLLEKRWSKLWSPLKRKSILKLKPGWS